jgi:ketosteroid isomerase-like protein
MTGEQTALHLLRQWVARFNQDDRAGFKALLHPEAEFCQVSSDAVDRGADAVVASMWGWRKRFITISAEIVTAFAGDDGAHGFMWVIWKGTRAAAGDGDPEAGRTVQFPAWFTITVRDSRIVSAYDFYDQLTYRSQFGE